MLKCEKRSIERDFKNLEVPAQLVTTRATHQLTTPQVFQMQLINHTGVFSSFKLAIYTFCTKTLRWTNYPIFLLNRFLASSQVQLRPAKLTNLDSRTHLVYGFPFRPKCFENGAVNFSYAQNAPISTTSTTVLPGFTPPWQHQKDGIPSLDGGEKHLIVNSIIENHLLSLVADQSGYDQVQLINALRW